MRARTRFPALPDSSSMEPSTTIVDKVVLRIEAGLDGQPLLLYESMLSSHNLDGNGFQHDSAVTAQCLLVYQKFSSSLRDLGKTVYIAPFDLFNSVIKSSDIGKLERLARSNFGQCIAAADVSFLPAVANTHFSLSVLIREERRFS
jgi:hypothetical protein